MICWRMNKACAENNSRFADSCFTSWTLAFASMTNCLNIVGMFKKLAGIPPGLNPNGAALLLT